MSNPATSALSSSEKRAMLGLAGIYGLRMLGLFLILPVFALYAEDLAHSTPLLVGLAIGVYGLTQAMLQIPFGFLSDRLGRKPVIFFGLILFAIGSLIAYQADSIIGVIIGRAIQGSGAIAAAIMALAADLTRESHRTKIMATIGMTIGASFMLALISGPLLADWIGVDGIFAFTAVTAVCAMGMLWFVVPTPLGSQIHRDAEPVPALMARVLSDKNLLRLDSGIFSLHLILTAVFLAVPLSLRDAGLASHHHPWLYLAVLVFSILAMVPLVIQAEKKGHIRTVFLLAIVILLIGNLLMGLFNASLIGLVAGLLVFFWGFNLLEALLPSLVSKNAPADAKGTAMGVYSTSQFAGAFVGGLVGGWVHQHWGLQAVFLFTVLVATFWLIATWELRMPVGLTSELLPIGKMEAHKAGELVLELREIPGVIEAVVIAEEGMAYLKIEKAKIDREALDAFRVADA